MMIIETQQIDVDDEGNSEITVSGVSLTTYLNHKVLVSSTRKNYPLPLTYYRVEAMALLLWNSFVNASTKDYTVPDGVIQVHDVPFGSPFTVCADATIVGSRQKWWVGSGPLKDTMFGHMRGANLGLKIVKPPNPYGLVVNVQESRNVVRTPTYNIEKPCIVLYSGNDRSVNQDVFSPVVFRKDAGALKSASYLFTVKDAKQQAYVNGAISDERSITVRGSKTLESQGIGPYFDPFIVRSMFVDESEGKVSTETSADYTKSLEETGVAAVTETQKNYFVFDGEIAPDLAYEYGVDYFLGDTVTVVADFGIKQDVVISEYTRSQDATGERGFPSFEQSNS